MEAQPRRGKAEEILSPAEAARMFRVSAATLRLWSKAGKIPHTLTAGGHRRYRRSEIELILGQDPSL